MRGRALIGVIAVGGLLVVASGGPAAAQSPAAAPCAPGGPPVEFAGSVTAAQAKTYQQLPFEVSPGTTRIEVTYDWSDLISDLALPGNPVTGLFESTFDLGLWDADGYRSPQGFRGWSGSRGGRVADGQKPVFVQQDVAARGYHPGPIEPGTWFVDLGIAAVAPTGASWTVTVRCDDPAVGPPFQATPVDPSYVADPAPGWYHGDFHVHGFHSHSKAPPWDDIVAQAREAGLDFLPVTEYVTGQHWDELGPVQQRNPDLLIWPGREIITYFGHAIALGETRSVLEYRHGFEDVSLRDIQDLTLRDGALFGVAHPTIFPEPVFTNFCRGCEFNLDSVVDWSRVDTIEVVTGPVVTGLSELGVPEVPVLSDVRIANPFVLSAIEQWEQLLSAGHRVTAVSGSDSKAVDPPGERDLVGIGSSTTAVFARSLSRPALQEGLRAGRAYVRTRGVDDSPAIEVTARAPDGTEAMIGDDLATDRADLRVTVTGGVGHSLRLHRNGSPYGAPVPITSDPFTFATPIERDRSSEGPLGTYVWVETSQPITLPGGVVLPDLGLGLPREVDLLSVPTVIANPVFLNDAGERSPSAAATGAEGDIAPAGADAARATSLARTGGTPPMVAALVLAALAVTTMTFARRSRRCAHGVNCPRQ